MLQELSFRSDVFDRRAVIYNAIHRYLGNIIYSGKYEQPDFETFGAYLDAVETTRFLFSKRLHLEVKALQAFVDDFLSYARHANDRSQILSAEQADAAQATLDRRATELRRRFQLLPELFEQEMSITLQQGDGAAPYVTSTTSNDTPDQIGVRSKTERS